MGWRFSQMIEIIAQNIAVPHDKIAKLMESMCDNACSENCMQITNIDSSTQSVEDFQFSIECEYCSWKTVFQNILKHRKRNLNLHYNFLQLPSRL